MTRRLDVVDGPVLATPCLDAAVQAGKALGGDIQDGSGRGDPMAQKRLIAGDGEAIAMLTKLLPTPRTP